MPKPIQKSGEEGQKAKEEPTMMERWKRYIVSFMSKNKKSLLSIASIIALSFLMKRYCFDKVMPTSEALSQIKSN